MTSSLAQTPHPYDIFCTFKSAAIIGASEDPAKLGGAIIFLLQKYKFNGRLFGVNPNYQTVQGIPCFPNVESLPDGIELAIVGVAAHNLRSILPALVLKGVRGVVIFSGGFKETGAEGKKLETWLSEFAAANRLSVIGPNCIGAVSFVHQRPLTFFNSIKVFEAVPAGRVALVSQSGGVATNLWTDATFAGVRFSHLITTGNEANIRFADCVEYLADDPDTDFVLGYVESVEDGASFCRALEAMQKRKKPLVLLKVGTSAMGRSVVLSHTGQLSSDDAGYQAAFRRYDVIRASSLDELSDFARVMSRRDLQGNLTVATTSGGIAIYVSDACEELGIPLSDLTAETEKKLKEIVPAYGRLANPVDLAVVTDISVLERTLDVLLADPQTGTLLLVLGGRGGREESREVIDLISRLQTESGKCIALAWFGVSDAVRSEGAAAGLLVFQDPQRFLRPFGEMIRRGMVKLPAARALSATAQSFHDPEAAAERRAMLGEAECMTLLEAQGIDCPKRFTVSRDSDIDKAANAVGFPCVLKISAPSLAHKSDSGGVIVGINSVDELRSHWRGMQARLGAVEAIAAEQIRDGVEMLVGGVHDPVFGIKLTVASGGIWTNTLNSAVTIIPPFSSDEVRRALQTLTVWQQLAGGRGQAGYAVDLLVDSILRFARWMEASKDSFDECECNPLIVTRQRCVAVDALAFRLGES